MAITTFQTKSGIKPKIIHSEFITPEATTPKILRPQALGMPAIQWTTQRSRTEATDITAQVGNTPLIDLSNLAHKLGVDTSVKVHAKAEWFNPGGSVKARAALRIIEEAEISGALTQDKILIDSSSGNTGIAFALFGAAKGYEVHLVMPANVSKERKALARAYGATLIESDPLEGSDGAILQVRALVAGDPRRYFYADQYNNDANWQAHFDTTGPEIWQQTGKGITHFVCGLGTTGTFIGTGRYFRQQNPEIELVTVQPEDELSVIEGLKRAVCWPQCSRSSCSRNQGSS